MELGSTVRLGTRCIQLVLCVQGVQGLPGDKRSKLESPGGAGLTIYLGRTRENKGNVGIRRNTRETS